MPVTTPEYLTTRELAELLRIKERKVYDLASSGQVPCTRATGKLLFPRRGIEAWLEAKHEGRTTVSAAETRPAVMLGSHDPLLEWALRESACGLASNFNGSLDGLELFASAQGVAAALHLFDAANDSWNVAAVAARFGGHPVVLMEFCWRERGLVIGAHASQRIQTLGDLVGQRVVPRQAGAGSQLLMDQLLQQQGLDRGQIEFTDVAYTKTEAVTSVLDGSADATLGLQSIARRFDLPFVPLVRERFDLLVERRAWFEPPFQRFLEFCRSAAFRQRAESLDGYDVSGFGRVRFNA